MNVIRDPVTGDALRVNREGYASVDAISRNEQMHANLTHQRAFTIDIDGILISSSYYILAVKNTDDAKLVIDKVTLWVAEFKAASIVEASVGGSFAYAAGGTAVVPSNCDAESGIAATGSFYVNDGAATDISTIVAGDITGRFLFTTTPLIWEKLSGWILPKNGCFFLKHDVDNDNTFHGYVSMHYED